MKQEKHRHLCAVVLLMSFISGLDAGNYFGDGEADDKSARCHQCVIDLSIDQSDMLPPEHLKQALVNATLSSDASLSQYASSGLPRLRKAIARLYSKVINRKLDPDDNVVIMTGATGALYSAIASLTKPGDEWIIIEPFYPKFLDQVTFVNAVPRFTRLKQVKTIGNVSGTDWVLDKDELESLFNERTRGIIFNNPQNPLGKIYSLDDMEFIADLVKKHNVTLISDEAHEWTIFDSRQFIRMATLPGMFERTITIGSASKTYSVTGWRIGWAYGPSKFLEPMQNIHDIIVIGAPSVIQDAVAYGFEEELRNFDKPESYFAINAISVTRKRNLLVNAMRKVGMTPVVPHGGYCMVFSWPDWMEDTTKHNLKINGSRRRKFSTWVEENLGLKGYPLSNYYSPEHENLGFDHVRFCFQKKNETIRQTVRNLLKLQSIPSIV